jgi:Rieske Fe-S protein
MGKLVGRREIVGGIGLSALLSLFPFIAHAAGPTLKATKVGQKIAWRGYIYTVVKSKGKLVWKQGSKVATAATSASATPTPTTSATPLASATPTPTKTAEPVAVAHPELGVFIAFSGKLKEGDFAVFPARNTKGELLNYALSRKGGVVKCFSTVCTHAGCIVQASRDDLWCPCHNSYFDAYNGKATGGPANDPLEMYKASEADGAIYIKI